MNNGLFSMQVEIQLYVGIATANMHSANGMSQNANQVIEMLNEPIGWRMLKINPSDQHQYSTARCY